MTFRIGSHNLFEIIMWLRKLFSSSHISQGDTLTDLTMEGSPHSVLRSLWLCSFPEGSTCRSSTSTPTTLGFMGFGYFCMAAVVTVSHGWLATETQTKRLKTCMSMKPVL